MRRAIHPCLCCVSADEFILCLEKSLCRPWQKETRWWWNCTGMLTMTRTGIQTKERRNEAIQRREARSRSLETTLRRKENSPLQFGHEHIAPTNGRHHWSNSMSLWELFIRHRNPLWTAFTKRWLQQQQLGVFNTEEERLFAKSMKLRYDAKHAPVRWFAATMKDELKESRREGWQTFKYSQCWHKILWSIQHHHPWYNQHKT